MKTIVIRITKAKFGAGPFSIYDQSRNIIDENISLKELIIGKSYNVNDSIVSIIIISLGSCTVEYEKFLTDINKIEYAETPYTEVNTTCMWRHLINPAIFNTFYGTTQPYIIEYPFVYQYQDEILQNVKDYTKVYKYLGDETDVIDNNNKVELDNVWFNKAIIYNGQQCSGVLELIPKPINNMKEYMRYPLYNNNSKTIIFTKSDNLYQYNTFWSVIKDKTMPIFTDSYKSLSFDKEINQTNMDYSIRAFRKEPFRAKDVRIRHILDNRDDVHLISQLVTNVSQISHK